MKLNIQLVVLIAAGLFILSPADGVNILVNGSFDQSKNGFIPDNWNGDKTVYSLSNESFSGAHSLQYSNQDPAVYKVCTQMLNIQPGLNYSAGVKIKTSNISGNDYGASFCVQWSDQNGKWLGGQYPKGIKGTNNWTDVNAVIFIPENVKNITFSCYVRKGMTGTAWFDDAFIKPYKTGKIEVMLLRPVYRGLLFSNENSSIELSVNLENDNKPEGLSISSVLSDATGKELIKDKTAVTDKNTYTIKLNPSGIQPGNYTLKVSLNDKNNSALDLWTSSIRVISRENEPAVYFDDNKALIVNRKKIFPLGMYWDSVTEPDLKIYKQSKFNFLLPYGRLTPKQMDLVEKYEMKVIYSVKDFYTGTKYAPREINSRTSEKSVLNKTVEQFKDHPALLGWYTNDEQSPDFIDRLNEHYNQMTSEDPNHPVISVIIYPSQSDLYLNSTDVIGTDPYVVPKQQLYEVGSATKKVVQMTENSRPVWMVIQAHNIGNYTEFIPNPKDYRTPAYDEMRCMSWQAITAGADGLIYYSYFDLKKNPDVSFDSQWSNLKKIAAEIDSYSAILLSTDKAESIQANAVGGDNSWFSFTTRKFKDQLYIFLVNNGKSEGKVEFKIPGNYKSLSRLTMNPETLTLNNSKFSDELKLKDVLIYKAEN